MKQPTRNLTLATHTLMLSALAALSLPASAQPSPPEAQVNALEGLFGKHPTARRSGAKGLCASGYFVGDSKAASVTSASTFGGQRVPAVVRFSVGGGSPKASDKGRSVRGLAVSLQGADGQQWQMATISAPVFFVAKPEQFAPFLQARTADPATGKADPARLKAFNDANPETLRQAAYLAKAVVPASYGSVQYWSANAFMARNAQGQTRAVRYQFIPDGGFAGLGDEQMKSMPDDFLADELRQRVTRSPLSFTMQFQLAEAGDPTNDPTVTWPEGRTVVNVGKLVIDKVEAGMGGACENLTFNPLVLPTGLQPSDDPVLLARAAPYAISLGRRLTETRP